MLTKLLLYHASSSRISLMYILLRVKRITAMSKCYREKLRGLFLSLNLMPIQTLCFQKTKGFCLYYEDLKYQINAWRDMLFISW